MPIRSVTIAEWHADLATTLQRELGGDADQSPPIFRYGLGRFEARVDGDDLIFEIEIPSSPSAIVAVTRPIAWKQVGAGHVARSLVAAYHELLDRDRRPSPPSLNRASPPRP